jgi:hypothetical protein
LTSGIVVNMSPPATPKAGFSRRVLAVSSGTDLIGIVGQIGEADKVNCSESQPWSCPVITRLGILQATRPGDEADEDSEEWEDDPSVPQAQKLLWLHGAAEIKVNDTSVPVWSHPAIRVLDFQFGEHHQGPDVPVDALPHQILLWGNEKAEAKHLRRISAFVIKDGHWPLASLCVIGMRAEFEEGFEEVVRSIGSGRPSEQGDLEAEPESLDWKDENLVHFDIDGRGGEYVSEIHVHGDARAIKLLTNYERECHFGADADGWNVYKPEEGEVLVGMAVAFGTPANESETRKYNRLRPTTVTGLVRPIPTA